MSSLSPIEAFKLARKPIPLSTYLAIYTKARSSCYINCMEGAKRLYKYLAPISIPPIPPIADKLNLSYSYDAYEVYELAKIISQYGPETNWDLSAYHTAIKAVTLELHKDSFPATLYTSVYDLSTIQYILSMESRNSEVSDLYRDSMRTAADIISLLAGSEGEAS